MAHPVDREADDAFREIYPDIVDVARAVRYFLARAVRYLASEAGIRQFLDIGTGLPTADNTHEVAQAVAPQSKIVYVDNDPLVLVHARAPLAWGRCGEFRQPLGRSGGGRRGRHRRRAGRRVVGVVRVRVRAEYVARAVGSDAALVSRDV